MSINFFFTISCHKISTIGTSKLHYNSIKRLNISYRFMLQIFEKNWVPDLSRIMSGFLVGPNSDPWCLENKDHFATLFEF